jgi:N-acetylglucosamine malate deacetylase 2
MEQRTILGIYAHPDDETSCSGALFAKYAAEGVDVHVVTATRGELGTLGTNGLVIRREDLGAVREAELRAVLEHYGLTHPPILFDYRDQKVPLADYQELVDKVLAHLHRVQPDVVLTFGPLGISRHVDHVTMSQAATEAFHRYRQETGAEPRLLYVALRKEDADRFDLALDGPDVDPNVFVDVQEQWPLKVQALRMYRSQEDAQELADMFEAEPMGVETFHQAYPKLPPGTILRGFWPESEPATA